MERAAYRDNRESGRERAPLRCLIVDDSASVVAELRSRLLRRQPGLAFLPAASNGAEALRVIRALEPDLLLLDLEMPHMDGLTVLRALPRPRPGGMRILGLASDTVEGGRIAWEALRLGAADILLKREKRPSQFAWISPDLEEKILPASAARLRLRGRFAGEEEIQAFPVLWLHVRLRGLLRATAFLTAHSYGRRDQRALVLSVPHPPRHTRGLREGLDRATRLPVRIARDGDRPAPGQVLLVPGGCRTRIEPDGPAHRIRLAAPAAPPGVAIVLDA
ncbi:MAG: response regulator, partial [Candidatus Eisenbacteria bacterium]|nr:response regulator [Candidatus Eisenbacteria bacterium]